VVSTRLRMRHGRSSKAMSNGMARIRRPCGHEGPIPLQGGLHVWVAAWRRSTERNEIDLSIPPVFERALVLRTAGCKPNREGETCVEHAPSSSLDERKPLDDEL